MALEELPRTLDWHPVKPGWVLSALTATGADDAAAHLQLIDQRKLPHTLEHIDCFTSQQACDAIAQLAVRGAPAIGVTGAYAMVLWARNEWPLQWQALSAKARAEVPQELAFVEAFKERAAQVAATRPTAVNLSWAVDIMVDRAVDDVDSGLKMEEVLESLEQRARNLDEADEASCLRIGERGADVLGGLAVKLGRKLNVQTHCNAGSLATVRWGTACSVIYKSFERGDIANVWVDETRPVDQGARLTAWEMGKAGVPHTLVCDDMAGTLMRQGKVDAVIVGADRICANGDVVNKIGTYQLAVLAKHHDVPFYVAAPKSTFDESLACGDDVVIEERDAEEVRCAPTKEGWQMVAPRKAPVYNPAFDVTPADLVTDIFTD